MIIRIGDGKIDECGVGEATIVEEEIGEEETGEETVGEGKSESRPETPGAEDAFAIRDERFADTKVFRSGVATLWAGEKSRRPTAARDRLLLNQQKSANLFPSVAENWPSTGIRRCL
jgi:hypothetical protein